MTTRRNASEPESAGEIRLRQTAQVSAADQTRTFEIAVVLPTGASSEEIQRAIQGAEIGMRGLSEQMDRQISAFREEALNGGTVVSSLPPTTQPRAVAAPADPLPAAAPAPAAEDAPPPASPPSHDAPAAPKMASPQFYRAAKALGFDAMAAQKALGGAALIEADPAEALERLRALATQPAAPPPVAPTRGFAEEMRPDDDDGAPPQDVLDDLDEPDFAPTADDLDGPEGDAEPKPDAEAERRRATAERRLRTLRALRGSGPPATPEQRQALANCFISPLGSDFARDLVSAIWHPIPGERLNAARTRNLVEWSKEDDEFEETAALIFDLARQPVPEQED